MNPEKYKKRLWTDAERSLLISIFPEQYTHDICKILNRSYAAVSAQANILGLKKSASFTKNELAIQAARLKEAGAAYRFSPGHAPANAGKKMDPQVYERVKHTFFHKGNKPSNIKPDWTEVLRKDKSGRQYWMIKLPDHNRLRHKHTWLYESHHGPVPPAYNVVFKDGNPLNCTIENLECISNAELMNRNNINRYPTELISTIKLVHKLKRKINAKEQN